MIADAPEKDDVFYFTFRREVRFYIFGKIDKK